MTSAFFFCSKTNLLSLFSRCLNYSSIEDGCCCCCQGKREYIFSWRRETKFLPLGFFLSCALTFSHWDKQTILTASDSQLNVSLRRTFFATTFLPSLLLLSLFPTSNFNEKIQTQWKKRENENVSFSAKQTKGRWSLNRGESSFVRMCFFVWQDQILSHTRK